VFATVLAAALPKLGDRKPAPPGVIYRFDDQGSS
jgi:hypothetical protein